MLPSVGRKRKPEWEWLPPRVYPGRCSFEYRPRGGKMISLCRLSEPDLVWPRYTELTAKPAEDSIGALLDAYLASDRWQELADDTRRAYERYIKQLRAVFGRMRAQDLRPVHIRKWLDARAKAKSRQLANREFGCLGGVCRWGYERGWFAVNPCKGIRKFREEPRERYVTDDEYAAVYKIAPANVRAAMEIAYLCAARVSDVLRLTEFELRDEGIFIRQGKTGKKQIKAWSPRLRAAVELARSQPSTIGTAVIIHTRKGQRYTRSGFEKAWQRAMKKAKQSGFTFHDLKAKGITDYQGDKKKFSGHRTQRMVEVYDRKPEVVATVDSEYPVVDDSVND